MVLVGTHLIFPRLAQWAVFGGRARDSALPRRQARRARANGSSASASPPGSTWCSTAAFTRGRRTTRRASSTICRRAARRPRSSGTWHLRLPQRDAHPPGRLLRRAQARLVGLRLRAVPQRTGALQAGRAARVARAGVGVRRRRVRRTLQVRAGISARHHQGAGRGRGDDEAAVRRLRLQAGRSRAAPALPPRAFLGVRHAGLPDDGTL